MTKNGPEFKWRHLQLKKTLKYGCDQIKNLSASGGKTGSLIKLVLEIEILPIVL